MILPSISFGVWDVLLVVVVSVIATALSYLSDPRWKAFLVTLPFPFTLAALAVGREIDATNVIGLFLLFLFMYGVRFLHLQLRAPIIPAIIASAAAYCICATLLIHIVPTTDLAFWTCAGILMVVGALLFKMDKPADEPHYRTPLLVWIKVPALMAVIISLVMLKHVLQSFMTMFPMVSTIGAYETRHSLGTTSRQFPLLMLAMTPMMAVCRLTQSHVGLPLALVLGWVVFLLILWPLTRLQQGKLPHGQSRKAATASD